MSIIRNIISNYKLLIVNCKLKQFHIPNSTFLILLFLFTLPPLSAQSPNYNIGDVITNPDGSKGVVFWLSPDGSGGWMCALNDVNGTFAWSTQSVIVSGFPALATPSTNTWEAYATVTADTAGYSHTQLLRAAGTSSTYPAAYAVDFAHGWYLPAIGQLLELYAQQPTILSALTANGGNEISRTNHYWSSTYATNSNGYYLYNPYGYWTTISKSTTYYIRPVRSFSTRTMVYDTTLTYQWSNGATTPYTNVSPTSSRSYTVTATSGFGCNNTAEVSVVVGNGGSQTIYDTICAGSGAYTLNGFNLTAAQTATAGDTICTTTLSEGSCSTTVTLRLHRKAPAIATLNAAICPGECYYLNGMELCNAGTYTQHLTAANGCDSVLTLHLNVIQPDTIRFNETICQGAPYTGHGFNIPADSTTYPHVIVETVCTPSLRTNCDSCSILTLTISAPEVTIQSTTDAICQGESATLSASLPRTASIGDILCIDSSIVKPSEWPVAGKTPIGVVFYVDNTQQHGWAVALKEFPSVRWGPHDNRNSYTSNDNVAAITDYTNAGAVIGDENGMANTIAIKNKYDSNFSNCQAAYNCYYYNSSTDTVGSMHQGWYLPAAGQLTKLYSEIPAINATLTCLGNAAQQLTGSSYWASSERNHLIGWYLSSQGQAVSAYKYTSSNNYRARAIRDF